MLLTFAAAYMLIGGSYIFIPPLVPPDSALLLADRALPLFVWGWVWIGAGVGMILSAVRHWRGTTGGDLGFGLGVGMPLLWGALGAGSTFIGAERGWVTGVVYGIMALAILFVAGMVDPRYMEDEEKK